MWARGLSKFVNDQNFISNKPNTLSYKNLSNIPTIPIVPTNISDLSNNLLYVSANGGLNNIYIGNQNFIGSFSDTTSFNAERSRFELRHFINNPNVANYYGAKIAFISKQTSSNASTRQINQSADIVFFNTINNNIIERLKIADNGTVSIGISVGNLNNSIFNVNGTLSTNMLVTKGPINTNNNNIILSSDITTNSSFGLYFNGSDNWYAIYRPSGNWTAPFVPLNIQFYTGINLITGEDKYPVNIIRSLAVGGSISSGGEILSGNGFRATGTGGTPYLYPQDNLKRFGQWRIGDGVVGGWGGIHFATNNLYLLMGNNNRAHGVWSKSLNNWTWYCDDHKNFNIYNNLNVLGGITTNTINTTFKYNVNTWHTSIDSVNRFYFVNNAETCFGTAKDFVFKNKIDSTDNMTIFADGHLAVNSLITTPILTTNKIISTSNILTKSGSTGIILPWRIGTFSDHQINDVLNLNIEDGNPVTSTYNSLFQNGFQGANPSAEPMAWNQCRYIFRVCALGGENITHTFGMYTYYYSRQWAAIGLQFSATTSKSKGFTTVFSNWFTTIGNDVPGYGIKIVTAGGVRIGNIYLQFKN